MKSSDSIENATFSFINYNCNFQYSKLMSLQPTFNLNKVV